MNNNEYAIGNFCYMPKPFLLNGFGAWVVTSKYEIQNEYENYIAIDEIGNGKAWVVNNRLDRLKCRTGFYDRYINERVSSFTYMLGAICGDVAGSVYEHHNIKYIPDTDHLIDHYARFTDDSVMTLAVAVGIKNGLTKLKKYENFSSEDESVLLEEIKQSVHYFGNKYPDVGYGGAFCRWLAADDLQPYGSWGNGSAMRASYAGWIARSLQDAEFLAEASAKITHNHPNGIKGAKAIAGSIYILMNRFQENLTPDEAKDRVYKYVSDMYYLNFTLDKIRPMYQFDVSCQWSVPPAIKAFLEGNSFSEVIALAISIGGDSDTIAAIAGSLAETIYPIPEEIRNQVLKRLDYDFKSELAGTIDFMFDTLNHLSESGRYR